MLSYFQSAKSKSIMDENVWRNGLLSKNVHDHFRNDKTIKALFKNNAYINKDILTAKQDYTSGILKYLCQKIRYF